MTRYFAQNTPRAGLEHMMMSVPGFQKRGGGMMILSRFCYKPEDVDCRYCLHYRRRSCQVRTCPYIAERLKSGAIEYLDLILEYFGHIPHAGLHKRIQAVEHWSGPDQAVLHTVSVHLRSRFADRVWDDAPPGYGIGVSVVEDTPIDVFFTFDPDPVLDCKILPEEIPEYTVGVIGSWSGERKYLSREEVGQLLSASDPKTRILAEMLRYFEGKTWIVSCADCQEAFGILADAEMREAFGLDEQEQIGPKLEM